MDAWTDVIAAVGVALAGIPQLRFYDHPADRAEPPAIVVSLPEVVQLTADNGSFTYRFPLWLLIAKADARAGAKEMIPYMDPRSAQSIRAAIEADHTLSGTCDSVSVVEQMPEIATLAGTEYFAVEFTLEVIG